MVVGDQWSPVCGDSDGSGDRRLVVVSGDIDDYHVRTRERRDERYEEQKVILRNKFYYKFPSGECKIPTFHSKNHIPTK